MSPKTICREGYFVLICLATLIVSGCGKPTQDAQPQPSPAAAVTATPAPVTPAPAAPVLQQAETDSDNLSAVAIRILNKAQRRGGVILHGQCGPGGLTEQYHLPHGATLEPMDKALQEVSAKYQNIYWRESPSSGVRIVDAAVKAKLLAVHLREFRIVEDREPDRVMAVLWRAPEVQAFLRRNHVRFARRSDGERKVISPPMIVEMKNATVADILDRIAAGYRQSPPKVWVYQECEQKKEMLVDVQIR